VRRALLERTKFAGEERLATQASSFSRPQESVLAGRREHQHQHQNHAKSGPAQEIKKWNTKNPLLLQAATTDKWIRGGERWHRITQQYGFWPGDCQCKCFKLVLRRCRLREARRANKNTYIYYLYFSKAMQQTSNDCGSELERKSKRKRKREKQREQFPL
jgi:hypothetical protein